MNGEGAPSPYDDSDPTTGRPWYVDEPTPGDLLEFARDEARSARPEPPTPTVI